MPSVFISYRRTDSQTVVGRIYDRLVGELGADNVFKDVDSIDYGEEFAVEIESAVAASDTVLVVIGPSWISATNPDGSRRLEDPDDYVRIEIETGLRLKKRLIPVLVDGAEIPSRRLLPQTLQPLIDRNAAKVNHDPYFDTDINRLIDSLGRSSTPKANQRGLLKLDFAVGSLGCLLNITLSILIVLSPFLISWLTTPSSGTGGSNEASQQKKPVPKETEAEDAAPADTAPDPSNVPVEPRDQPENRQPNEATNQSLGLDDGVEDRQVAPSSKRQPNTTEPDVEGKRYGQVPGSG